LPDAEVVSFREFADNTSPQESNHQLRSRATQLVHFRPSHITQDPAHTEKHNTSKQTSKMALFFPTFGFGSLFYGITPPSSTYLQIHN
jgi:hypothetical protein